MDTNENVEGLEENVIEFGDVTEKTMGAIFGYWDGGFGLQL
jgi:hypothetical protein